MLEVKSYNRYLRRLLVVLVSALGIYIFLQVHSLWDDPERESSSSLNLMTMQKEFLWSNETVDDPSLFPNEKWLPMPYGVFGFSNLEQKYLYIRVTDRNTNKYKSPVIFAEVALEAFRVFQGKELVYQFLKRDFIYPHIIPISNIPQGYIYLEFQSNYHNYIGMDRAVFLQDHSIALVDLFLKNFIQTFLAPVLLVLSFIFLGFYFLRRREKIFLNFSLLLASASVMEALNGFVGFSLSSYAKILVTVTFLNLTLFPVLVLVFLYEVYPKFFRSSFVALGALHTVVFFTSIFVNYDTEVSFLNSEDDYNWVVAIEAIVTIFISLYVMVKGDRNIRIVTVGILIIVLSGFHDILVDMDVIQGGTRIIQFGFWIMICLFAYFVFRHYWLLLNSIDQMNLELLQKNKELARLVEIDKDLVLAKSLQASLLSETVQEDDVIQVSSFSQNLESVGGDYFDCVQDSLGNWGFLVTDVSGHGISSAMVAAMSKMAFVGANAYLQFPNRVIQSMNRHLVGKTKGMFITASYLFLDIESLQLNYCNAGHPGFFWYRADVENLELVRIKGKPLGLFPSLVAEEGILHLHHGDKLLMYTDGILDLLDESQESFGEERLRSFLWEMRHASAKEISRQLKDYLSTYSSVWKYQMDDISFISIEIK